MNWAGTAIAALVFATTASAAELPFTAQGELKVDLGLEGINEQLEDLRNRVEALEADEPLPPPDSSGEPPPDESSSGMPPDDSEPPPPPDVADFYVAPNGDGNACTQVAPCSVQTGISRAGSGQIVGYTAGSYPGQFITKSGVTYLGLDAAITGNAPGVDDCVRLEKVSDVVFLGFTIRNCGRAGIGVNNGASGPVNQNIVISHNDIGNTRQAGISVGGHWPFSNSYPGQIRTRNVKILNNYVHDHNQPSGVNEGINAANGVDGLEIAFNRVGDGNENQYGIDMKQGVRNFSIHDNYIWGHEKHCIYLDSNDVFISDGEIYQNICLKNRTGITMAREDPPKSPQDGIWNIRVRDNQFCNNSRWAVLLYRHADDPGQGGRFDDIVVANNVISGFGENNPIKVDTPPVRAITTPNTINPPNFDCTIPHWVN